VPVPGKRVLIPTWHRFGDGLQTYYVDHVIFNATPVVDETVFQRMPQPDTCRPSNRGIPMATTLTDVEDVAWRWACGKEYAQGGSCESHQAHLVTHAVRATSTSKVPSTGAGHALLVSHAGQFGAARVAHTALLCGP